MEKLPVRHRPRYEFVGVGMQTVIKITAYDPLDMGNDEIQDCDAGWHLVDIHSDSDPRILCSGFVFGRGASAMKYELKKVKRGGITCYECLRLIKAYKAVKL